MRIRAGRGLDRPIGPFDVVYVNPGDDPRTK
jgi:hypothetical protein